MPTYTIVSSTKDPLGPNEINAGTTIQVSDGDVYIFDSTADANATFEASGGVPANFDVQINDSNSNTNVHLIFGANLTPNVAIADNVVAPDVEVDARNADAINLTIGDNATFDDMILSDGDDTLTVGDGVTLDDIDARDGADTLRFGDGLVADTIEGGAGDDFVAVGTNAAINILDGESGTDTLYTQTSGLGAQNFETESAVCYAAGTLIDTPGGQRQVETLRRGDAVLTLDNGPQDILWVRRNETHLDAFPREKRPILIAAGALGNGLPGRDLIVSPQHRVLVGGQGQLEREFRSEALVPAKALTGLPGIRHMMGKRTITWVHFACRRHEVVFAESCMSESLLLAPMALGAMTDSEREEIGQLFGIECGPDSALNGPPARTCLSVGAVRRRLGVVCQAASAAGEQAICNRRPELC